MNLSSYATAYTKLVNDIRQFWRLCQKLSFRVFSIDKYKESDNVKLLIFRKECNVNARRPLFKNSSRIMRKIGRTMHLAGYHNEAEVLLMVQQIAKDRHWEWFASARISTEEEDAHGIDIVVETSDIGKLFFQVKSSRRGAAEFQKKRRGAHIAIIVASRYDSQLGLSNKITGIILAERKSIMAMREGREQCQ